MKKLLIFLVFITFIFAWRLPVHIVMQMQNTVAELAARRPLLLYSDNLHVLMDIQDYASASGNFSQLKLITNNEAADSLRVHYDLSNLTDILVYQDLPHLLRLHPHPNNFTIASKDDFFSYLDLKEVIIEWDEEEWQNRSVRIRYLSNFQRFLNYAFSGLAFFLTLLLSHYLLIFTNQYWRIYHHVCGHIRPRTFAYFSISTLATLLVAAVAHLNIAPLSFLFSTQTLNYLPAISCAFGATLAWLLNWRKF